MRCAFRENRDRLVAAHRFAQIINLVANAQSILATDEDGVVDRAEPADQRPFFDAIIGDKGAARDAGHYRDIDPAVMVGRVKYIFADTLTTRCGCNPRGPTDRQQEKPWPRGGQAEQAPDIVKEQPDQKRRHHQQQAGCEHQLPQQQGNRVALLNRRG